MSGTGFKSLEPRGAFWPGGTYQRVMSIKMGFRDETLDGLR